MFIDSGDVVRPRLDYKKDHLSPIGRDKSLMWKASYRRVFVVLAAGALSDCVTQSVPQTTTVQGSNVAKNETSVPASKSPSATSKGSALPEFDCDAPPAQVSQSTSTTISGLPFSISGAFQVNELRQDPTWRPTVAVNTDLGDKGHIGLRIARESATGPVFIVEMYDTRNGDEDNTVGSIQITQGVTHFLFALGADSTLRVSVAGLSGAATLKAAQPVTVYLACSTAKVHFSNLIISDH